LFCLIGNKKCDLSIAFIDGVDSPCGITFNNDFTKLFIINGGLLGGKTVLVYSCKWRIFIFYRWMINPSSIKYIDHSSIKYKDHSSIKYKDHSSIKYKNPSSIKYKDHSWY
jgi:hypothetical protein